MADQPTVTCNAGQIIGISETVLINEKKVKIKKFLGIPYASHRRFKKAVPIDTFSKPYEATGYGKACPQPPVPGMFPYETAEDCLILNIYVPNEAPDDVETGHAVIVNIHGGGFSYGAGQIFPGDNLAAYGNVIVVNFNYRLGFFGFLSSGDKHLPGNLGLYDQHLALHWVHDNIGAFGGDVNRITISGESAGGTSVFFQGMYPKNRGLFQRMITAGASPTTKMYVTLDPRSQFLFLAKSFGCDSENTEEILSYFESKSTKFINDKLTELGKDPMNQAKVRFAPTVDGDFMKLFPYELNSVDKAEVNEQLEFFQSLDLMSGFNRYEGSFFLSGVEDFFPSRETFDTQLVPAVLMPIFGPTTLVLEFILAKIIAQYTSRINPDKPERVRDQYVDLWGDTFFKVGTVQFSKMHVSDSLNKNSYLFEIRLLPKNHLTPIPSWVKGPGHGDDMLYITYFDKNMLADMGRTTLNPADWEKKFALQYMTYWTNFVKSGNPNKPREVPYEWLKYDSDKQRCLIMNRQYSTEENFYAKQLDFWLNVIPGLAKIKI